MLNNYELLNNASLSNTSLRELFNQYQNIHEKTWILMSRYMNKRLNVEDFDVVIKNNLHYLFLTFDGDLVERLQKYVPLSDTDWHQTAVNMFPHLPLTFTYQHLDESTMLSLLPSFIQFGKADIMKNVILTMGDETLNSLPIETCRALYYSVLTSSLVTEDFLIKFAQHKNFYKVLINTDVPISELHHYPFPVKVRATTFSQIRDLKDLIPLMKKQPNMLKKLCIVDKTLYQEDIEILQEIMENSAEEDVLEWVRCCKFKIRMPIFWLPNSHLPPQIQNYFQQLHNLSYPIMMSFYESQNILSTMTEDYRLFIGSLSLQDLQDNIDIFRTIPFPKEFIHMHYSTPKQEMQFVF